MRDRAIRGGGWALALALLPALPTAAQYVPDAAAEAYASAAFATGTITVAKDCSITGDVHGNSTVSLAQGTVVGGDLSAVGAVALNGATVTGTISSPAAPRALPRLPNPVEARALADRTLEGDHSFPDGTTIDDVVFVTGTARFEGSVDGRGSVIAGVEIRFDNAAPARPIELGANTDMTFVSLGGIWLGMDRSLRGALVAGGPVQIHKALELEGLIVAGGDLALSKDSVLVYRPLDREPPIVSDLRPPAGASIADPRPAIGASFTDEGSGVDGASIRLTLDGADRTGKAVVDAAGVALLPSLPLALGPHRVELTVSDRARNTVQETWEFTVIDVEPPAIVIEHPQEGSFSNRSTIEVQGTVADASAVTRVTVNGAPATQEGRRFAATLELEEGLNTFLVVAVDAGGNVGLAHVSSTIDTEPPQLTVTAPSEGQVTNGSSVRIRGETSDRSGIASVTVDGLEVPQADGAFEAEVELAADGPRAIPVVALDRAGNASQVTRQVVRRSLPDVTITAPDDLAFVAATTTSVSGTVGAHVVAVSVNGVPASLDAMAFLAEGVPLIEGGNTVTATAVAASGLVATDTIHVVRDLTPPRVFIHQPEPGTIIRHGTVSVSGLVNDIVPGTVNAHEASVTVNGVPAVVSNRSFFVESVALAPGENVLHAVAVDESGNAGEDAVVVTLDTAAAPQVRLVAGDHQTGVIGDTLPLTLVAELVDGAGRPVPNRHLIFRVQGTNGSLDGGKRQVAVTTDAAGRAQTRFTLGTRAGVANQVVEASAVGFAGPAVFTASGLPAEPAAIVVDSGGLQVGVAGQRVPRPLIAAVTDRGHNRLEAVPVTFQVVQGAGRFADGSQETNVPTDSDGRAIVTFTLDPEEGVANNVVEARILGLEQGPMVSFVATGRAAGDPAATSISGVVLDNTNAPITGATLRVKHTSLTAVSDEQGQFRITGAPVGAVKLIVDGSTVARPGAWPDLEFDLVTIAGRDTTVNMPIFLLPLDLENGVYVDETRGGLLTVPDLPGFALEIEAGSVTFPTGSRSGLVSVTVVHNDKVPMTPNFGQQPRLIVTIQPAGARFDPPARLTLPNVEGLAPGEVTEMYSFDHDLGHFVSIGPATVSADATVIASAPGVGIVKAGWHCGGNPASAATTHACPVCTVCTGSRCVPRTEIGERTFASSTAPNDDDLTVRVDGREVREGALIALPGPREIAFEASFPDCLENPQFTWTPDPISSTEASFSKRIEGPIDLNVVVSADCGCPAAAASRRFRLVVYRLVDVRPLDGPIENIGSGPAAPENLHLFGALRADATVSLEAVIEPDVPKELLPRPTVRWLGDGSQGRDEFERVLSIASVSRQQALVLLNGGSLEDRRDVNLYVPGAEFSELRPSNGHQGVSFPNYEHSFYRTTGDPFIGTHRPRTSGDFSLVFIENRAEYQFKVLPVELTSDLAAGLVGEGQFRFAIAQDAWLRLYEKLGDTWRWSCGDGGWRGDPGPDNDDLDPGDGLLHGRDRPSYTGAGVDGASFKLNLRTWVNCGISSTPGIGDEGRCSEVFEWRVFRWVERGSDNLFHDTGGLDLNHVLQGAQFWGPIPPDVSGGPVFTPCPG